MPIEGLLEGLVGGFGEQAQLARQREQQRAEQTWQERKNFLTDYAEGRYGPPTPEGLQEAFQGLAELSTGPKPKKGRGIMGRARGEMEVALPSLLQRLMSGDAPTYNEDRPAEPVNQGGRPDVSMQQQPPAVPQAGTSEKRFAQAKPPTATIAEGNLADAAMRASMAMGESGPIQSRPISGTAQPPRQALPSMPMSGQARPSPVRRTGPAALFLSPEELMERQLGLARRARLGEVDANVAAYESFPEDYPEGRRRSLMGVTHDPATAARAGIGASSKTFVNPEDPSQQVEARPDLQGPGWVDMAGNPVPPTWIEAPSPSGSGGLALETMVNPETGETAVWSRARTIAGTTSPYASAPEELSGYLPTSVPIAPGERISTVDVPDAAQMARAKDYRAIVDDMAQRQISNMILASPEEISAVYDQVAQDLTPYRTYNDLIDASVGATTARVPAGPRPQASLPPPPSGYPGTPGITPGPGAPQPQWAEVGWLVNEPPPDPLDVETASDDDIFDWYIYNTAAGQALQGLAGGDVQALYDNGITDGQFMDKIRAELLQIVESINAAATAGRP